MAGAPPRTQVLRRARHSLAAEMLAPPPGMMMIHHFSLSLSLSPSAELPKRPFHFPFPFVFLKGFRDRRRSLIGTISARGEGNKGASDCTLFGVTAVCHLWFAVTSAGMLLKTKTVISKWPLKVHRVTLAVLFIFKHAGRNFPHDI